MALQGDDCRPSLSAVLHAGWNLPCMLGPGRDEGCYGGARSHAACARPVQIEGGFSQPNGGMCEKMLTWAAAATAGSGGHDLLELYCGNGNFTAALAPNFRCPAQPCAQAVCAVLSVKPCPSKRCPPSLLALLQSSVQTGPLHGPDLHLPCMDPKKKGEHAELLEPLAAGKWWRRR